MSFVQSPNMELASRNKALLDMWRDTLRTQSRGWPIARLATIRLDATLWKGLDSVVAGAGSDSPAAKLIAQFGTRHNLPSPTAIDDV